MNIPDPPSQLPIKIDFVIHPEEYVDCAIRRAEPSVLLARKWATFGLGPVLGLILTAHSPVVCCLIPPTNYYTSADGHFHSTSTIIATGVLIAWRASIYITTSMLACWLLVNVGFRRFIRHLATDPEKYERQDGQRSIEVSESGLLLKLPSEQRSMTWQNISEMQQDESYFYFTLIGKSWFVVPKRAFPNNDQMAAFVETVRQNLPQTK